MSEKSIQQRLSYFGLEPEELAILGELRPLLESHANEMVEAFYRKLLLYPETRRMFTDAAFKDRFLEGRRRYLMALSETELGDDYLADRRTVARAQERAGLGPEWTIRLAAIYFTLILPLLGREYAHGDLEKLNRMMTALVARVALDIEIQIETYVAQHEKGLAYLAEELAHQSRELQRNLRLQDAELRETTARARAAEELASIATLVAGLAHEIGTPMSVIQGHAKLLEGSVSGEDAKWRLQTIQEQIARISGIIHTLLQIAHPRRSRSESVDLARLIEQTLEFVAQRLEQRDVLVVRDLRSGVGVVGDSERLQQLFLNLFLNAADAMPSGGVLGVELRESPAGGATVRVSDSGVGIAPDDLERIFEPFFTTKEAGHGSGLGLMVCKGIVADHGGEIGVISTPGRGTQFTVSLPGSKAAPAGVT
jgi:signal transduction histidine kinase